MPDGIGSRGWSDRRSTKRHGLAVSPRCRCPRVRHDIEEKLRARLIQLVQQGADVVLDFSFWSRQMRDEYREILRPWGACLV